MSDRERVSDERLRDSDLHFIMTHLIAGSGYVKACNNTGGVPETLLALAAELLDARDRIARAAEVLGDNWLDVDDLMRSRERARAILTGEES